MVLENSLPSENGCALLSAPLNFFVLSLKSDLMPLSSFTPSPQTAQARAFKNQDHSLPQSRGVFPSLISLRRLPNACLLLLKQLISLKLFVFPTGLHFNALGLNFNNKGSTGPTDSLWEGDKNRELGVNSLHRPPALEIYMPPFRQFSKSSVLISIAFKPCFLPKVKVTFAETEFL